MAVAGCPVFVTQCIEIPAPVSLTNLTTSKFAGLGCARLPYKYQGPMNFEGVCVAFEISSPEETELRKGAYAELRHETV
jgi:hypothetical protein